MNNLLLIPLLTKNLRIHLIPLTKNRFYSTLPIVFKKYFANSKSGIDPVIAGQNIINQYLINGNHNRNKRNYADIYKLYSIK